jgi:3-oxosteroid 1-dehydrogenase
VKTRWDDAFDVVVLGSGMAGLSAALAAKEHGLKPALLEKGDKAGGGTVYSYGLVWVGNNPIGRREGYADSREETIAYLKFLGAGYEIEDNLLAFVDGAPVALEFFMKAGIPFQLCRLLPDHYYDMAPGSKKVGRTVEVALLSGYDVGEWREKLVRSPYLPVGATSDEFIRWGGHGSYRNWSPELLAERRERDMLGCGAGLAAHFLKAVLGRDVPIMLSTGADRLVTRNGAVVGVVARQGERELRLRARRGVVIATGGYEANRDLVRSYEGFRDWETQFPPTVTGDGLVMAAEIGARVHLIPMNMAIFLGFRLPPERPGEAAVFRLAGITDVCRPHTLVVNRDGERFADESYFQAVLNGLRQFDVWQHRYSNLPCYLIFDQNFADKYPFAGSSPGRAIPEWVTRADTLRGLAKALDIDGGRLEETARRFNEFALTGKDEDFQRGTAAWASSLTGDPHHTPNPNLGPVERPPFYGVRLVASGVSSAGLLTNRQGQVLHLRGHAIPGLYASGNAASFVDYGAGYQAGLSLARGMTFSYLAVRHMIEKERNALTRTSQS